VADEKLKKSDDDLSIALRRTKDIAATLGAEKGDRVLVGFAMETQNERENAAGKLTRKNFDFIVLNSLRTDGAGFRGDTNVVTLIDEQGAEELPLMTKRDVAKRIVQKIETFL
jgi:phosphopantothenoylcysteine decarboxylase/phosphopantothenate--cysteine ligase